MQTHTYINQKVKNAFFFSARPCASVCLVNVLNPVIVTQFFWGRGMILTVINLSDYLCEIY